MTKFQALTNCIKKLSQDSIIRLLDAANILLESENILSKPDCPYCGKGKVIRYGHKCKKQRFLCKDCERTFVTTTHTIMSQSHFGTDIWQEVLHDTVYGNAIDYTAKNLGLRNCHEIKCIISALG